MDVGLLDHRYLVSSALSATADTRRFAGRHVGLDTPVRIIELEPPEPPEQLHAQGMWDAGRCASLATRAAALHHPALPRVRDCFCVGAACYVVEDVTDGEQLGARLGRRAAADLRSALRDALHLCDAVARIATGAPEMLACLLITSATLEYDAGGMPYLTTWDYARWWGGGGTLDLGAPDLRAPELLADARSVPDERAHVYSIAALVSTLLTGSTERPPVRPDKDLPRSIRAALEPALRADPNQRTPTADTLGRALAHAARVTLPRLEFAPVAQQTGPSPVPVLSHERRVAHHPARFRAASRNPLRIQPHAGWLSVSTASARPAHPRLMARLAAVSRVWSDFTIW
jgi:hypothetical protein